MKSITFVFLLTICTSLQTQAQARWELGIQLEYGRDWYDREYYNWVERPSGYIENFPSYYSRGAGFHAERVINPQFSALAQISYFQKKMHVDMFDEASGTHGGWITKEMHHRGAIDAGVRWYVNPKSKIRLFVDGKLGANMFIAAVQRGTSLDDIVNHDAFGYDRITPFATGTIGAKWQRLSVSVEYRQDLAAAKRARTGTGITSRGVVGKVAFVLFRAGN
ncbi:hypothetical protein [Dyadobacter chenhuakuii]|uniref:Outer membrane protein beta-barrel domain-containing protein n=1 Tax=Dyadobacter chenhuakuii TaxID=2909339 RepID=A0ABY4XFD0_9BACT|nr:hypothetical protein [Dyadobacter chenhuakuii]MCF2496606.1 hypothetical protein [Dyadobacter chenhuakuii]USJ29134.1 hypothetical protein NFI80_14750 [Dyadobacter chenhuakuii]